MHPLLRDLNIQPLEVITLVGTGGKTTLLFFLAHLLAKTHKVLVTTTTKILVPPPADYDRFFPSFPELQDWLQGTSPTDPQAPFINGVVVAGGSVNPAGKLTAFTETELRALLPYFDVILIEGDGSRGRPLKAWQAWEPVVPQLTTKTIGVLPITALGLPLDEQHVYNPAKFQELFGPARDADLELLQQVVLSPQGLFQQAQGEKVLLLNQADTEEIAEQGKALVNLLLATDRLNTTERLLASDQLLATDRLSRTNRPHLIDRYFVLSLEELRNGSCRHYFSCRPGDQNAGREAPLKLSANLDY